MCSKKPKKKDKKSKSSSKLKISKTSVKGNPNKKESVVYNETWHDARNSLYRKASMRIPSTDSFDQEPRKSRNSQSIPVGRITVQTSNLSFQEKLDEKRSQRQSTFGKAIRKTKVWIQEAITAEPVFTDSDWEEEIVREEALNEIKQKKVDEFRQTLIRQSAFNPEMRKNQEQMIEAYANAPLRLTATEMAKIERQVEEQVDEIREQNRIEDEIRRETKLVKQVDNPPNRLSLALKVMFKGADSLPSQKLINEAKQGRKSMHARKSENTLKNSKSTSSTTTTSSSPSSMNADRYRKSISRYRNSICANNAILEEDTESDGYDTEASDSEDGVEDFVSTAASDTTESLKNVKFGNERRSSELLEECLSKQRYRKSIFPKDALKNISTDSTGTNSTDAEDSIDSTDSTESPTPQPKRKRREKSSKAKTKVDVGSQRTPRKELSKPGKKGRKMRNVGIQTAIKVPIHLSDIEPPTEFKDITKSKCVDIISDGMKLHGIEFNDEGTDEDVEELSLDESTDESHTVIHSDETDPETETIDFQIDIDPGKFAPQRYIPSESTEMKSSEIGLISLNLEPWVQQEWGDVVLKVEEFLNHDVNRKSIVHELEKTVGLQKNQEFRIFPFVSTSIPNFDISEYGPGVETEKLLEEPTCHDVSEIGMTESLRTLDLLNMDLKKEIERQIEPVSSISTIPE